MTKVYAPTPWQCRSAASGAAVASRLPEVDEARKQPLEALFRTVLQQLMTGQVRVDGIEV